jgi:hypothetical protein
LTTLGKIKKLQVIVRASVRSYRAATVAGKLRDIGRTLRVSHVLEGGVRRSSNRVVINVALLDMRDDRQVWSERYERTLTDTLPLQGELAIEIARALQANLTLRKRATSQSSRLPKLLDAHYISWLSFAPLTPALLRIAPVWDPLRDDPLFQKLIKEGQLYRSKDFFAKWMRNWGHWADSCRRQPLVLRYERIKHLSAAFRRAKRLQLSVE